MGLGVVLVDGAAVDVARRLAIGGGRSAPAGLRDQEGLRITCLREGGSHGLHRRTSSETSDTNERLASPVDMSELQSSVPTTLVSPEPTRGFLRAAPAALRMCLVVSPLPQRSRILIRAAQEEHWATIVCREAEEAARQAVRNRIQLALVDIQAVPASDEREYRRLVEQLAGRGGPLVAVCGNPNDSLGEVWSRQLGVWMYLPGVDSESDLAIVYSEARAIVEKLYGDVPLGEKQHGSKGPSSRGPSSRGPGPRGAAR